jgi:hypothetical protein
VPLDSLPTSASNQDASPVPAWLPSASGTTGRLRPIAEVASSIQSSFKIRGDTFISNNSALDHFKPFWTTTSPVAAVCSHCAAVYNGAWSWISAVYMPTLDRTTSNLCFRGNDCTFFTECFGDFQKC